MLDNDSKAEYLSNAQRLERGQAEATRQTWT